MTSFEAVNELLSRSQTIAVIGISDKPARSSYGVAEYLCRHYEVIPVNPALTEWQGRKCYASLLDIPRETKIDIVDIFRRSEFVPEVVDEAIQIGAKAVWMQLGVIHEEAKKKAEAHGLTVVMDLCIAVEDSRWRNSQK